MQHTRKYAAWCTLATNTAAHRRQFDAISRGLKMWLSLRAASAFRAFQYFCAIRQTARRVLQTIVLLTSSKPARLLSIAVFSWKMFSSQHNARQVSVHLAIARWRSKDLVFAFDSWKLVVTKSISYILAADYFLQGFSSKIVSSCFEAWCQWVTDRMSRRRMVKVVSRLDTGLEQGLVQAGVPSGEGRALGSR